MTSLDTLLDAACNWLASNPRATAIIIAATVIVVGALETPA